MNFYNLSVKSITKTAIDAVIIRFEVPSDLMSKFLFEPGQYLTLEVNVKGEVLKRSYSICSSDNEDLSIGVRAIEQGVVSNFMCNDLKVGDTVKVSSPKGNFILSKKRLTQVFIAAGSGITPILSMIKSLSKQSDENMTLLYSNRQESSTMFLNEIKQLETNTPNLNVHYVYTSVRTENPLLGQLISKSNIQELMTYANIDFTNAQFYICGPEAMTMELKESLVSLGVNKEHIQFELFFTTSESNASSELVKVINSKLSVTIDGDDFELDFDASKGQPILDQLIDSGFDIPYSCKGAVCCTCKTKLLEGKVSMDKNFALSDEEVEEGYVLACQARPLTDKVTLDFDVI